MVGTQEPASLGQTVVVVPVTKFGAFLLGIDYHAAELIDIEWTAKTSYTLLLIDDGAVLFALDGYITIKEEWREDNQTNQRNEQIEHSFNVAFKTVHSVDYVSTLVNCHICCFRSIIRRCYYYNGTRAVLLQPDIKKFQAFLALYRKTGAKVQKKSIAPNVTP
jgi:hypothetical protein